MDSFSEDSSAVPQRTGTDPTIHVTNRESIDEDGIYLDHPRGPDHETSTDAIDANDPDEVVAEKSTPGKFNRFKSVLPFGKSGKSESNLNESSTVAVDGSNPDGPQDPNNEENNPGGTEAKRSFLGGIKNALPFGKTPPQTDSTNEAPTGTPGRPGQMRATTNGTLGGANRPPQQDNNDFAIISSGFNNKKSLANGLMDFAFLTANANQLYYAVASRNSGNERIVSIVLISTSIFLQIVAGILLICTSYMQSKPVPTKLNNQQDGTTNSEDASEAYIRRRTRWLNLIDHWTIALVFIIAITNIFIAAFSTTSTSTPDVEPPVEN